ncbi:MAG: radical SAM protein, partial [Eubacterium sp.]
METTPAKTLVTKNKSTYWFGAEYTMNIYRGCCHGCIYCDSRSECYRNDRFDTVMAKENALDI